MAKIKVLNEGLANRIAAGQVVGRPACVVKELVENAVDAKATAIHIDIAQGGKEAICVTDNGEGMDREDATLCFSRHATSKLTEDEDLFHIATYGFRGEAIPSIAAVSLTTLSTTRKGADTGTEIITEAGHIVRVTECPVRPGTQVSVRNLFYNIPARRKFQKSVATEYNHILEGVMGQALALPHIAFTLVHNRRELFKVAAVDTVAGRIRDMYGASLLEELRPLSYQTEALTLSGFVSVASVSRANRNMQKLFVNGRVVKNQLVYAAIAGCYREILAPRRHPLVFLYMTLPYDAVDVNVHPTKDEVKFKEDKGVYGAVTDALKAAIYQQGSADKRVSVNQQEVADGGNENSVVFGRDIPKDTTDTFAASLAAIRTARKKEQASQKGLLWTAPDNSQKAVVDEASSRFYAQKSTHTTHVRDTQHADGGGYAAMEKSIATRFPVLQNFCYFKELYIALELDGDLCIVDQHAACERILYEKLRRGIREGEVHAQRLLLPVHCQVVPELRDVLTQLIPQLTCLGFDIEPFGDSDFVVRALPVFVEEKDISQALNDWAEDVKALGFSEDVAMDRVDEAVKMMSCRLSYKAGDKIGDAELAHIVSELLACEEPACCPHGRPCILRFDQTTLEKMFRRKK